MKRAAHHYGKSAVPIKLSEIVHWSFLSGILESLCGKSYVTVKAVVKACVEIAFYHLFLLFAKLIKSHFL